MSMLTPTDARRRWFGAFFLICSLGMLIWGVTFLATWLLEHKVIFILYWIGCALFTGLAFLNAMLDMFIMRRRIRHEQSVLAQKSFEEIEKQAHSQTRVSQPPRQ
jgi:hypothetical protein